MMKKDTIRQHPTAGRTVLVVDDNEMLVEFAATVLKAAGHSVKQFSDPKAALRALDNADPKPDVLVTDYEMGEMNGLELIQRSLKIHPALKTLLLSGTVDGSITLSHPVKVDCFLGKPYKPEQLLAAVAGIMKK
jgi:CheY-like chemotaxis protein